jgi:MFS family permease
MRLTSTQVPILLSEIAPPDLRGMFVSAWQMLDALGILIGFIVTLALCGINHKNNWRYMLGGAAAPAVLLLFIAPLCVESPRWLLKRGEIRKALEALIELYELPSPIIACGDLLYLHELLQDETRWLMERAQKAQRKKNQTGNTDHVSLGKRWSLMFATRRMRTAILVSMTVMLAQQACGINLLAFLSSNFYFEVLAAQRDDGHGVTLPPPYQDILKILELGCGFGAVNFLYVALLRKPGDMIVTKSQVFFAGILLH